MRGRVHTACICTSSLPVALHSPLVKCRQQQAVLKGVLSCFAKAYLLLREALHDMSGRSVCITPLRAELDHLHHKERCHIGMQRIFR